MRRGRVEPGLALAEQGRLAEAERAMREALRLTPDWRPALVALGKLPYQLDRKGESVQTLQQAVAVDPKSSETRIDLGIALAQSEDREGALAAFTEAVRLAPKSARATAAGCSSSCCAMRMRSRSWRLPVPSMPAI